MLISDNFEVIKYANFGFSKEVEHYSQIMISEIPKYSEYAAPELYEQNQYDHKIDIW